MVMANCKLTDCTVAEDGRCLEGRGGDCPNLLADSSPVPLATQPSPVDNSNLNASVHYPPVETLHLGVPLEIADAQEFCRRGRAIVVTLVGMTETGKTSLLARFHQLFQSGPVGGYDFAGSRTLPRFEELNWLATIESGVGTPRMEHSSRQYDNSFLHFTVRERVIGSEPFDILLNDISGETFPEVIAAESVCEQLLCLSRADHLAVIVDGAAITKRHLRHDHVAKAMNFVQRVLQTGQINKQTVLHLIITKLDELSKEEQKAENLEAAEKLETDFKVQFSSRVARIHCWRLAARPLDGSMPTEEIVTQLFSTWAGSTCRYENGSTPLGSIEHARDFCRFGS